MEQPRPFKIEVPDSVLQDLHIRLNLTKTFPDNFNQQGRHYGQDRELQKELINYWKNGYDWRKHEAELNALSNFKCKIQGLDVHFIHQKSSARNAIPLLIVHGWPGSVWEFHKVIPKLTTPDSQGNAFHVIAPSIPGYGWSEAAKEPGMSVAKVALMFDELMVRLGYKHYFAQGGDWGSIITKLVAIQCPKRCALLHQNMPIPSANFKKNPLSLLRSAIDMLPFGRFTLSESDKGRLSSTMEYAKSGNAYLILQASKPHSLGDALEDSPAGLVSWIVEKCLLWADTRKGGLLNVLSKDDLLTNVMIYWVTGTITSSMRLYYESLPLGKRGDDPIPRLPDHYVHVPTGIGFFPKEAIAFPLSWLKLSYNIVHHTEHQEGGHFAAWEQPDLFDKELRNFAFKSISFKDACSMADARADFGQESNSIRWLTITAGLGVTALLVARSAL